MNTIKNDVRVDRNKLALEVAKLPRLALRKLLDKWREECFKREPCEDGTYESRLDWDEFDSPVVVPTNLSLTSPAEAAVRLAVLHDYVFPDGDIEAICTKEWRDSLDRKHAISIICFERIAEDLDQAELVILERHLIDVQQVIMVSDTLRNAKTENIPSDDVAENKQCLEDKNITAKEASEIWERSPSWWRNKVGKGKPILLRSSGHNGAKEFSFLDADSFAKSHKPPIELRKHRSR